MGKLKIEYIDLDKLILDKKNPRFAELYSGSDQESELIDYLLWSESGEEIAKKISQTEEFYPDRPLWVLKDGEKFIVKDGNRRCAAVKALQYPLKHGLNLPKLDFQQLPVLIYQNEGDLQKRIYQEHTASLFREWERIAKALEVYRLWSSGSSEESLREIDSSPAELIKLASFYYKAVGIKGDDLRKLLRRGKGKTGGKTIIFERLFPHKDFCGYRFKNKPSYEIEIFDQAKFHQYISAIVDYLTKHPETTHKIIDNEGSDFLKRLENFGFNMSTEVDEKNPGKKEGGQKSNGKPNGHQQSSPVKKGGTVKSRPDIERKSIPPTIKKIIDECYSLDHVNFANAKMALTRVTFECILKYIIENTKYNGKILESSPCFQDAFYKNGKKRLFTNFEELRTKFIEIIKNTGKRKAFGEFDLERLHQIIHNYNVGALPADSKGGTDNLMPLIEFMLQDESDLLNSLNVTKL